MREISFLDFPTGKHEGLAFDGQGNLRTALCYQIEVGSIESALGGAKTL